MTAFFVSLNDESPDRSDVETCGGNDVTKELDDVDDENVETADHVLYRQESLGSVPILPDLSPVRK